MTTPSHPSTPINYGLATGLLRHLTMGQALERIAEIGIRWVEASCNEVHLDPRVKPDLASIRRTCTSIGMEVRCVHLPFLGLGAGLADPAQFPVWRALLTTAMEHAAEVGARVVVTHTASGGAQQTAAQAAENQRVSQTLVADLARRARTLGLRVAVENELTKYTPLWAETLASLATLYPDPEVGFCLDTGHAIANGQDCLREIASAGDRLIALHLNSNDARTDLHLLPDQGQLPWPRVRAALLARFHGLWTLEIQAHNQPDAVLSAIARFVHN